MINKLFDDKQISTLKHFIDHGVTPEEIAAALMNFGSVTRSNREDALMSVYCELLKGKFLLY